MFCRHNLSNTLGVRGPSILQSREGTMRTSSHGIRGIAVAGSILALSLFSIGCGSSNSSSNAVTQTQALTAASDLVDAMSGAITAPGSGLFRTPATQEALTNHIRNAKLTETPIVSSRADAK